MNLKHINFIVLAIILIAGVATFRGAKGDSMMQLFIGIATTISYILWGMMYHWFEGDLHTKVVIEYLLVGAIAVVLLLTVLWT